MKEKIINIFWGIVLIGVAGLLLAQALGYVDYNLWSNQTWVLFFGIGSAAFFLSYALNGLKKWGWLFPAFIFAALAITIWMAINRFDGAFMGSPILAAVGLPFYVGFLLNRKSWGLLIPAFILTVLSLMLLVIDQVPGEWVGAAIQFAIGLPFLIAWLVNRKRWGLLIPAYVLIITGLITLLSDLAGGQWIGALTQFAIAAPFLLVWLLNRTRRWALIPAFVLGVTGLITLLSNFASGEWMGAIVLYAIALPFLVVYLSDNNKRWALIPAIVLGILGTIPLIAAVTSGNLTGLVTMFLFAAPFFVVYFWSKKNWWALIPAGIFTSIGAVLLLILVLPGKEKALEGLYSAIIFLGFAITFGILWLLRKEHPTGWAKWPALGLLAAALLALALGGRFQDFWPAIILLAIGISLLVSALGRKKVSTETPAPPENTAPKDTP